MYIKNFLQVKFGIIILLAIANFSHCADLALAWYLQGYANRFQEEYWRAIYSESRLKHVPTLVFGTIGAVGVHNAFLHGISTSNWYKTALPASLLIASPAWATCVRFAQDYNDDTKEALIASQVPYYTAARYALPVLGVAGLVTWLGKHNNNSLLTSILCGAGFAAFPAWYARAQMVLIQKIYKERKERDEKSADCFASIVVYKGVFEDMWKKSDNHLHHVKWALARHANNVKWISDMRSLLNVCDKDRILELQGYLQQHGMKSNDVELKVLQEIITPTIYVYRTSKEAIDAINEVINAEKRLGYAQVDNPFCFLNDDAYEKIEAALRYLAKTDDLSSVFACLFQQHPMEMYNVLHEFNKRTQLYQSAGIQFSPGEREKVASLIEQARRSIDSFKNDLKKTGLDTEINILLLEGDNQELLAQKLRQRLDQIIAGPGYETDEQKKRRLQHLQEDLESKLIKYKAKYTYTDPKRLRALLDLYLYKEQKTSIILSLKNRLQIENKMCYSMDKQ